MKIRRKRIGSYTKDTLFTREVTVAGYKLTLLIVLIGFVMFIGGIGIGIGIGASTVLAPVF